MPQGAIGDGEFQLRQEIASPCQEDFDPEKVAEETEVGTSSSSKPSDFSDPVFRKLSRLNGEINRMHKDQLRRKLAELKLHTGYCFAFLHVCVCVCVCTVVCVFVYFVCCQSHCGKVLCDIYVSSQFLSRNAALHS